MTRWSTALALGFAWACVHACSSEERPSAAPQPELAQPDPRVQWLRRAEHAHALADRAADPAARAEALQQLVALAQAAPPAGIDRDAAVATRQDLYARAARIAAELDQRARALQLLDEGLLLPAVRGPFRTQLLIATAQLKRALGDEPGAEQASQAARDSLR
jgi:hypothetical protein